jgi:Na+/H+ antiporter NhaC
MQNTWLVVLPPLVVVILAMLTRRTLFSIIVGIVTASLVVHDFQPMVAAEFMLKRIWATTELSHFFSWDAFWASGRLFVFIFLVALGVLISLLQRSGAAYAYGDFVKRRVHGAAGAERASLLLSFLFFIDDYFSCLTVGAVMQPITDRFKVPRVKEALLVNTLAAPLVVCVPLSSWVAYIITQLRTAGIDAVATQGIIVLADPLYLYALTIPFIFYALIMITSIWYMVSRRLSFGIVARHEDVAQQTGDLFGGKRPVARVAIDGAEALAEQRSIFSFLYPLLFLFFSIIGWILYTGQWSFLCGDNSLITAFQTGNVYAGFFVGGMATMVMTFAFFWWRRVLTFKDLWLSIKHGWANMGGTVILLVFIWTFVDMLSKDLGTGKYLADLLVGHVPLAALPVMFFVLTSLISALIASAWGTLGIMIPIGLQMLPSFLGLETPIVLADAMMIFPLLGAIISGAIVANQVSPLSDQILLSSSSVGSYHLDLVKAQASMAVPVIAACVVAFGAVGLLMHMHGIWLSALIALGLGILTNILLVHILHYFSHKKSNTI